MSTFLKGDKTSSPTNGDIPIYASGVWTPARNPHRSGTGSPEGVVAAPVGTRYTDTASTTGALEWIKRSGSGTTGWGVSVGDTGWRQVTPASGTGGSIYLKRDGSRVAFIVSAFRPGATGTNLLLELPAGFRPRFTTPMWADETNGTPRAVYALHYAPYRLEIRNIGTVGAYVYASGIWDASDPWPATLPGTPA